MERTNEEETMLAAAELAGGSMVSLVLKAGVELGIFDIIAKSGPDAQLSSSEIASHLPTTNPEAPAMLERMLRFLATHRVLTCSASADADGNAKLLYSLGTLCKYFVRNSHGTSFASFLLFQLDKVVLDSWVHFKDAIIEGGVPFYKAHGMHPFEYHGKDDRFNRIFNEAMVAGSRGTIEKILEIYKGFQGVKAVVDVGGGLGATSAAIVAKNPNIRAINFDLPYVIKDAPVYAGVEHVTGDMFDGVPKGDCILLKWILHDWSDDHCLKLLKNCWNALPESGKLIVVESILPDFPETDSSSKIVSCIDILMLTMYPGGKERTEKQLKDLATKAGFKGLKLIGRVNSSWVIEIYKNM